MGYSFQLEVVYREASIVEVWSGRACIFCGRTRMFCKYVDARLISGHKYDFDIGYLSANRNFFEVLKHESNDLANPCKLPGDKSRVNVADESLYMYGRPACQWTRLDETVRTTSTRPDKCEGTTSAYLYHVFQQSDLVSGSRWRIQKEDTSTSSIRRDLPTQMMSGAQAKKYAVSKVS
jgi:hypothetical protein